MSDAMKLVQDTMADPACAQPLNCAAIENPALADNLAVTPEAIEQAIEMQVTAHPSAPAQQPDPAPEVTVQPPNPSGFS